MGNPNLFFVERNQVFHTRNLFPEISFIESSTQNYFVQFLHLRKREPVSYTHLDVYKRQVILIIKNLLGW